MKFKNVSAFVLLILASCLTIQAQTVSPEAARAKALNFFNNGAKNLPTENGVRRAAPRVRNVELAYTSEKDGKTCFYVYNNGENGGFVIVGGDKSVQEILAYSNQGHFDSTLSNPNLKWWVETTEKGINRALRANARYQSAGGDGTHVDPLLTTQWGQDYPYNLLTPTVTIGDTTYQCPAGCVATAMAQVINYHQHPNYGIGQHSYFVQVQGIYRELQFDFANTSFDYANMRDTYKGNESEVERNAVATLMYACGVAVNMEYGIYGSGAQEQYLVSGLRDFFGYYVGNPSFDYDIIQRELDNGNPLLYGGGNHMMVIDGYDTTHMMVIDGYDTTGLLHLNMGWEGRSDGYYAMSDMCGYTFEGSIYTVHVTPDENPDDEIVTIDDIIYELHGNHTAYLKGLENDQLDSIFVPSTITHDGTSYAVIKLEDMCLRHNEYLRKVVLSEGLLSIGHDAFQEDRNLTEINIPVSVTSFGKYAFASCSSLRRIELSKNVVDLPQVFGGCTSLSEVLIDSLNPIFYCYDGGIYNKVKKSLIEVLSGRHGQMYIHEGTEKIEDGACQVTNISEYILPSSVREIGINAFCSNHRLKRVVFSDSCEIVVPHDWATISDCDSLEYVYIPRGLDIHMANEFAYCPRLKTIDISPEHPNYTVINNIVYSKDTIQLYKACVEIGDSVILPQNTKFIETLAFSYSRMKYVDMSHIVAFGDHIFMRCYNLESIEFPEGIQFIPPGTCSDCFNLKEITLPSTLLGVYSGAFWRCNKLLYVNCKFSQPFTIVDPIIGCVFPVNGLLTVPQGTKTVFENVEGWKDFTIVEKSNVSPVGKIDSIKISVNRPYIVSDNDSIKISVEVFPDNISHDNIAFAATGSIVSIDRNGFVKSAYQGYPAIFEPTLIAYSLDGTKVFDTIQIQVATGSGYGPYIIRVTIDDEIVKEDKGYGWPPPGTIISTEEIIRQYILNDVDTVRDGMTFSGWTFSPIDDFYSWVEDESIDDGYWERVQLVTGHFISNKYQVTFIDDADIIIQKDSIDVGCAIIAPECPTREGYTFIGWSPGVYEKMPAHDVIYKAMYTINSYSLKYYINDELYENDSLAYGSCINLLEIPTKDGYIFSGWSDIPETMPAHDVIVTANYAILGDVNLDEKVNVTDVVDIVNDRLGYESLNFVHVLSDVNRDDQYTITDAIAVLNIMYGEPVGANAAPRREMLQAESLNMSQMNNNTIALSMGCANNYTAFQFDVELPEGSTLDGISLNENRCKGFVVRFNKVVDNIYKVVAYNLANEPLSIGNDNLLTINLTGINESDDVRLSNIHFSTQKAEDVLFDDIALGLTMTPTGIQSNVESVENMEYNAAGQPVTKNYKGIVIINGKKNIRK